MSLRSRMMPRAATLCALLAAAACSGTAGNVAAPAPANGQAAAPAPAAGGTPFAEFDRVCTDLADPAATAQSAVAAGWTQFTPEPSSTLGQLLALADRISSEMPDAGTLTNLAYRKAGGSGELNLVISSMRGGPAEATECRVYDFGAATAPTAAEIAAWTSTPPTNRVNQQGVTSYEWSPGFRPGLAQMTVVHVAEDSPLRQQMPVIGLGVTASRAGAPGGGAEAPAPADPAAK